MAKEGRSVRLAKSVAGVAQPPQPTARPKRDVRRDSSEGQEIDNIRGRNGRGEQDLQDAADDDKSCVEGERGLRRKARKSARCMVRPGHGVQGREGGLMPAERERDGQTD